MVFANSRLASESGTVKDVDKVEVRTKGQFTRATLNQELDPSESGMPSLHKLVKDLTSWICFNNNNFSAP